MPICYQQLLKKDYDRLRRKKRKTCQFQTQLSTYHISKFMLQMLVSLVQIKHVISFAVKFGLHQ